MQGGANGAFAGFLTLGGGKESAQARHSRNFRRPSSIPSTGRTADAPVPPPPRARTRATEAVLGGLALVAAGAALAAVRAHGHNLALDQAPLAIAEELHNPTLTTPH